MELCYFSSQKTFQETKSASVPLHHLANLHKRYKCNSCSHQFQSQRKKRDQDERLLNEYIFGKQTLKQLSIKTGHSYK